MSVASLLSAMLPASLFSSESRLFGFSLEGDETPWLVERFRAHEALSDLPTWQIDLLSTDASVDTGAIYGKQAALRITLADGSRIQRSGYVSNAVLLAADGGLARYRLTLVPWLWFANDTANSRVFLEQPLTAIIESVLAPYANLAQWRLADEVTAFLAELPPRSLCVQYRETDYAFLSRLLAEEGLGFCFRELAEDGAPADSVSQQALHEWLIFADAAALPQDRCAASAAGGAGLRFHRAAAPEEQDSILAFGAQRRFTASVTTLLSTDYKADTSISASLPAARPVGGPNAPALEDYDFAGAYAFANSSLAERYARLAREAIEARQETWLGHATVRTLRPGTWFDLKTSLIDDLATLLPSAAGGSQERRFLVCSVEAAGKNNLPVGLSEAAGRLRNTNDAAIALSPALLAASEEHGFACHFSAQRALIPWRPQLTDDTGARLNPRPTASGLQHAVVVGANGEEVASGTQEVHTDSLGRIRVRFLWQQPDDPASCWVRVVTRHAGSNAGTRFIPRIGQEVLISFMNGDIDRPVCVGAAFNGRGENGVAPSPGGRASAPDPDVFTLANDRAASAQGNLTGGHAPLWHAAGAGDANHRNAGAFSGIRSRAWGGGGWSELVFDDSDNQLRTQVSTTQQATSLALGHLIHTSDNYRGSFRGKGFELRTDAFGAINGGRGVLLSSYAQRSGDVAGDNAAGVALARQAQKLAEAMNGAAKTHQTVPYASHVGGTKANACALTPQKPLAAALTEALSGCVAAEDLGAAYMDAALPIKKQGVPHSAAALLAVSAKAGIALTAADSITLAANETALFATGANQEWVTQGNTRLHTGQTLGILAGAEKAGDGGMGLSMIAGAGPLRLEAHSDILQIAAKDDLKILSANASADFAAAKKIHLATAGGAAITIEGGNITVQCPGTLTVHASQKSFAAGGHVVADLPHMPAIDMPASTLEFRHITEWGEGIVGRKFKALLSNGEVRTGVLDEQGFARIDGVPVGTTAKIEYLRETRDAKSLVSSAVDDDLHELLRWTAASAPNSGEKA
ncbi:type VI secretion system Vgr family protein [Niveibacterium microcysteis]|uniref:Type VI secretion system tip protein VgrG n=1 Tax=Niveibacterium microcysteis TaxID=2811415 RepID=A0ABX7M762_9RHOO|nr:type VI secretion system Vgr family protein [Niveibacterium microcysteis]QSI76300.1 type VI secretion system tip protein VgrG [Niveibacterium microcysteis]